MAMGFDYTADSSYLTHHHGTDDEGTFTEEERELIGREAQRLKREFEVERNKRRSGNLTKASFAPPTSYHPSFNYDPPDPIAEETERGVATLRGVDRQVQETLAKKQVALKEMKVLQEAVQKNRNDLKMSEKQLRDIHGQHADIKSELALMEYKRETLKQEVHDLDDKLSQRRKLYDNQLEMNTGEILAIIEERDGLKRRLQSGEATLGYIERLEHERQISIAKDELFAEQRSSRLRIEALQEELDEAQRRLEEFDGANQDLVHRINSMESEYKSKLDNASEVQSSLRGEIRELRNQVEDRKVAENRLEMDLVEREKMNQELQQFLIQKEREITDEHESRAKLIAEKNFELAALRESKENSLISLKDKCSVEAQAALESLDNKKEAQKKELSERLEEKMAYLREDHCKEVDAKNQEIAYLKDKLRQQEDATRDLGERLRLEAQEQVRSAVSREKSIWDDEQQRLVKKDRNNWEDELARTVSRMNEAIEYERSQLHTAQKQISSLRKELDDLRQQNKDLHREATTAMVTSREAVHGEHQRELQSLREKLGEERQLEVCQLQKQISSLEEEIHQLKGELQNSVDKTSLLEHNYDHHEKTLILEINDECKKLSQLIGINPRKVNIEKYDKKARSLLHAKTPHRSPTTDCLANLRACISELVPFMSGLVDQVEATKLKIVRISEEKDSEMKALQEHLLFEKEKEVELTKEHLTASHLAEIQQLQDALAKDSELESALRQSLRGRDNELRELKTSMQRWKEETADKLAKQFEKEVDSSVLKRLRDEGVSKSDFVEQQNLIARLEDQINRLKSEQALMRPGAGASSTAKLLHHLQDRVRLLKTENLHLKSGIGDY